MTQSFKGELEIDYDRGVIYFHAETGITFLRICNLPTPIPHGKQLDVTHMVGTNWWTDTSLDSMFRDINSDEEGLGTYKQETDSPEK